MGKTTINDRKKLKAVSSAPELGLFMHPVSIVSLHLTLHLCIWKTLLSQSDKHCILLCILVPRMWDPRDRTHDVGVAHRNARVRVFGPPKPPPHHLHLFLQAATGYKTTRASLVASTLL